MRAGRPWSGCPRDRRQGLRGAWSGEDTQIRLLSAMLHGEGVVVAQVRVPDDTNEITQVEELVGKLPEIPGRAVVTLDAVHAQHATAELLGRW